MIYEIIVYELWILDFTVVSIRRRIGKLYICEIVNPQCKGCRVGRWKDGKLRSALQNMHNCTAKYRKGKFNALCKLAETCGSVKVV